MGRKKKIDEEKVLTPKESISDIFDEMINEEKLTNDINKKEKKKYTKKSKIPISSDDSNEKIFEFNHDKIKEKHKVIVEKLSVVDKFYKKYPHLKKDKKDFVKEILDEPSKKNHNNPQDYILEKIFLENNIYYRDNYNNVVDPNLKLVGFYQNQGKIYKYILFNN
jgi:hypothetical protein